MSHILLSKLTGKSHGVPERSGCGAGRFFDLSQYHRPNSYAAFDPDAENALYAKAKGRVPLRFCRPTNASAPPLEAIEIVTPTGGGWGKV